MDTNNLIPESGIPLLPSPEDCGSNPPPVDGETSFVQSKQERQKEMMIEQLKKMPIIHNCCEKIGISRATHYRWTKDDEAYEKNVIDAIFEGKRFMNEMAENNLLTLVRDQSFPAISFWLKTHHADYKNRLEVTGKIATVDETPLTPEQKQAIEEALRLATTEDSSSNPLT